jgi:signal transduction histidine kinase/CheY-like chemotaxis protein
VKLRTKILLFFFLFALAPLVAAVLINLPLVLDRLELFYQQAYLQNLRADFRDLDQHLSSRDEMVRLLSKLPEPGSVLGVDQDLGEEAIDLARARYTEWLNQVLGDQLDVVQILFLDAQGRERFWLERDSKNFRWLPTIQRPRPPPAQQVEATLRLERPAVLVSPIVVDAEAGAQDPRHYMTLKLGSPVGLVPDGHPLGAVFVTLDVAGLAHRYRNTLWVNSDGSYLQPVGLPKRPSTAFDDFPGLREQFATNDLVLWKGPQGRQVMWVPLLRTVTGDPLWVGRPVDPSPLAAFKVALSLRVMSIILALTLVIWLLARRIALRAERFGDELTEGLRRVLEQDTAVQFRWRGAQELRELSDTLTRLAEQHVRNSRNLRAHARELEASNRYKSQFLANVSHELRTPLNSILLLSKLIADESEDSEPERARQARVIHGAGRDLLSLIDNILDLSRIEAGRTTFNLEEIDLPQLLAELVELLRPQFDAKQLELRLEIAADAVRRIDSDPDKIRQILKNFLGNAVKFTERGGVVLRLAANTGADAARRPVAIAVSDTGIGVPPDKQAVIFEAFKQADGSTSRKYGGSGLGLTISRQLAELIGGAIVLESTEGRGSTFSLLLPLEFDRSLVPQDQIAAPAGPVTEAAPEPTPAAPAACPSAQFGGRRVLVVESDVDHLLLLTPVLEAWGLEVDAADDVAEATELLRDEGDYALVLVDAGMSGAEAYARIQRVRGFAAQHGLPLLALAGAGTVDAGRCGLDAGDVLEKPLDAAALCEAIERHLGNRALAGDAGEA